MKEWRRGTYREYSVTFYFVTDLHARTQAHTQTLLEKRAECSQLVVQLQMGGVFFPFFFFSFFFCLPVFSHFYNEHTLEMGKDKSCSCM